MKASEIDKKFDNGEDISEYLDMSKARRPMILWDRVKKSLDEGVEVVMRVSRKLSERAHIEAAVARLMIEKGTIETKVDRINQKLGERVYAMWEQSTPGVMKDAEVAAMLKSVHELNGQIAALDSEIKRVSSGDGEG
jgi:uncharacterized protein Yka (UPF0111/DUF47 family)